MKLIGDGEHAQVVKNAMRYGDYGSTATHIAFVGLPGDKTRRINIEFLGDIEFGTIIHPKAIVNGSAIIGEGCFIGAGAIIQNGVIIGKNCVVNTGAIVEHDCELGDGVIISSRVVLGGGVKIESWAYIGLGACVRDHITIGEEAIVGMGAVVTKSVPAGVTVMGCPAKEKV